MCVSALVENDLTKLAAKLGLSNLSTSVTLEDLPRRIEARDPALVIRQGTAGRFVAEPMAFNPYVLKRQSLGGDMWAEHMLASRHGIIVLKGYSEWVSLGLLIGQGMVPAHEAHCAFNRFATPAQRFGSRPGDKLVLANFSPASGGSWLVPVLFDARRDLTAGPGGLASEFAVVSDEPTHGIFGISHSPICLDLDAALEWLCVDSQDGEESEDTAAIDWYEVLNATRPEPVAFGLFKST